MRDVVAGVVVVTGGASAAVLTSRILPWLSPLVAAMAVGVVVENAIGITGGTGAFLENAGKRLLRAAIVLLGFRLALWDVVEIGLAGLLAVSVTASATFFGSRWLGRRLGLSRELSTLVGAGYAICGLSAVAAIEGIVEAEESETAYAIGLVTLAGTSSILILPLIASGIGMDSASFGRWAGSAVHDVAQTVATASLYGDTATTNAVVVKLSRVLLLMPLVALVAVEQRRTSARRKTTTVPLVPLFVIGFLVAAAIRTSGLLSDDVIGLLRVVEGWLFAAALFAIGSRVRLRSLTALGGRPLILGVAAWVVVALVGFVSVTVLS